MKPWLRSSLYFCLWGAIGLGIGWLMPGVGQSLQYWVGIATYVFLILIVVALGAGIAYVAWHWVTSKRPGAHSKDADYSRDDPPWRRPRRVNEYGTPTDRANYRALKKRLKPVSTPIADETLRKAGRTDAPLNDYFTPCIFVDPATGQGWIEVGYEVGFNQWCELVPIDIEENESNVKKAMGS